jgi:hypothetical protein
MLDLVSVVEMPLLILTSHPTTRGHHEPALEISHAHARRVDNGTGKVELRTRVESNETELVLVPTDGSEPLWLARTPAYYR